MDLPVAINRIRARLVLDTGAARTAIATESAARLGLDLEPTPARAAGIGTREQSVQQSVVALLQLASVSVTNVHVLATSHRHVNEARRLKGFPPCDGVLGADLLLSLAANIDYGSSALHIQAPLSR